VLLTLAHRFLRLLALDEVSRLAPEYPAWMDVLPSDRRPGEERRFEKS